LGCAGPVAALPIAVVAVCCVGIPIFVFNIMMDAARVPHAQTAVSTLVSTLVSTHGTESSTRSNRSS
jgi:hypothetical protein